MFWKNLLLSLGKGAAQGFLGATQQPDVSVKNAGIAALIVAGSAGLNFAVGHPALHPDVVAATSVNTKVFISTDGGATWRPQEETAPAA